MSPDQTKEFEEKIQERFKELPKTVQDAITSADVEKRMRALADTQKLHLDQWESLENEVMLALLGFQPIESLEENIKREVQVSDETAKILTEEISKIVFEPIRGELERKLDHPEAKGEGLGGVEEARKEMLHEVTLSVAPATPPAPVNTENVLRAPISEEYKPGETSTMRKNVADDPYRESPV